MCFGSAVKRCERGIKSGLALVSSACAGTSLAGAGGGASAVTVCCSEWSNGLFAFICDSFLHYHYSRNYRPNPLDLCEDCVTALLGFKLPDG